MELKEKGQGLDWSGPGQEQISNFNMFMKLWVPSQALTILTRCATISFSKSNMFPGVGLFALSYTIQFWFTELCWSNLHNRTSQQINHVNMYVLYSLLLSRGETFFTVTHESYVHIPSKIWYSQDEKELQYTLSYKLWELQNYLWKIKATSWLAMLSLSWYR
jgi:hypothetical protein